MTKTGKHEKPIEAANHLGGRVAYSPRDAAIASGRSRTRIFGAIKSGELVARKDGGRTLIEAAELCRWVASMPKADRTKKEVQNHA